MTDTFILDDITNAIVTAGIGQNTSDADWRVRAAYIQSAPDRSICVYETGGAEPETGQDVGYPTFQVRVRGKPDDYQAARVKEEAIFKLLHATDAVAVLGNNYVYCFAVQSGPMSLGQDELRRPAVVRNYRVMKSPV